MNRYLLIAGLFSLILTLPVYGQSETGQLPERTQKQRPFSLTLEGASIALWSTVGMEFEYFYRTKRSSSNSQYFLSAAFHNGRTIGNSDASKNLTRSSIAWGSLYGNMSSHFEFQAGLYIQSYSDDTPSRLFPKLEVAYRYQPVHSRILIKVGIGVPEGVFAGFGIRF